MLSQWTVYNNGFNGTGGEPAAGISTTYFAGENSLVFSGHSAHATDDGAVTASANVVPEDLPKGVLHGKLRTHINPVVSGPANHGLICMQSALNMQAGHAAKGYAVMLDSVFSNNRFVLVRMNDGVSASLGGALGSTYSLLGESAVAQWVQNTVYTLEIEWHVDTVLGGIYVIGRRGTQSDFSDLTTFATCLDATAHAQLTSLGEGPYACLATNSLIVAFGTIRLYALTAV